MPNYQNGKIYKIINDDNDLYYGSTTVPLWQRIGQHRRVYKGKIEGRNNKNLASFEILKFNNVQIVLVEDYPCERKEQLHSRERFWIENNKCVNKCIPCRTLKEYRDDNKEKKKLYDKNNIEKSREYKKKWKDNNKDKIKEYNVQKIICECGCEITRGCLSKHRKTKKHNNLLKSK